MAADLEARPLLEDFAVGQLLDHGDPHVITQAEVDVCRSFNGDPTFRAQIDEEFARSIGYAACPVDEIHVFNDVFGLTVNDVSLNARANLGYSDGMFIRPVYPGDTVQAKSEVFGVRETSAGDAGIVWVHSTGYNQEGESVLSYKRWVMVPKRDPKSVIEELVPHKANAVAPDDIVPLLTLDYERWGEEAAGDGTKRFDDYRVGQRLVHDSKKLIDVSHMDMTELHQNAARVHFDERQVVYGGLIIATARAQSSGQFPNSQAVAINGGSHLAMTRPGNTISSWSEVVDAVDLGNVGILRVISRATRDLASIGFPAEKAKDEDPGTTLEFDYWVAVPK